MQTSQNLIQNAVEAGLQRGIAPGQMGESHFAKAQGNMTEGTTIAPVSIYVPSHLIYRRVYTYCDEAFSAGANAWFAKTRFYFNKALVLEFVDGAPLSVPAGTGMNFFQTANNTGLAVHPNCMISLIQNGGALLYSRPFDLVCTCDQIEIIVNRPGATIATPRVQIACLSMSHPW